MGGLLNILEERFGRRDPRVIKQKEVYSMLELQHYFLVRDYNLECDGDFLLIMFFYSNDKDLIGAAERQGFILNSLKKQNEKAMIYSFDYDLDFDIINLLKEEHEITKPNIILISEKIKVEGLQNIEELERYLE